MTTTLTPRPPAGDPDTPVPPPTPVAGPPSGAAGRPSWWRRPSRPAWSVPARASIFLLAAVLYVWDLSKIGMGNTFYAAAVKSGTERWKAFFFGSLDPGSFITVDKPPAALWVMELSGRVFGFSTWSMLLPEAVAGVVTVMVLYHLVRRWAGEPAAVLAALALTLTPVAVVIFRYNDPDAFLTLLLVLAAWALWSALETGRTGRLVLSGALVGVAFLTKTLDAFIVLPAFGAVYLWCGRPRLRRRIGQLAWAGLALVASSGWWIAVVELWPAAARPYIGGSTDNSEFNLIFGYNGFSRIFGSSGGAGAAGGPGGGTSSGGATIMGGGEGVLRMFNSVLGGQISWLLPLALVGLVGGLWLTRRDGRTSLARAGWVLWGGWLLMLLVVYSDAKGIFHPYYTVILAPAIAALAGAGAVALWKLARGSMRWVWVLPSAIVGSAVWSAVLLDRTHGYYPWLGPVVIVGGLASALALLAVLVTRSTRWGVALIAGAVATASLLAGPTVYSLTTVNTATSAVASAGPATTSSAGGPGGGGLPGGSAVGFGGPGGATAGGYGGPGGATAGGPPSGAPAGGPPSGGFPAAGQSGLPGGGSAAGPGGSAATGGAGGMTVSSGLVRYLEAHQGSAEYLVAVEGSMVSSPIIIDTGRPVITMGGFNGSDPAPTLAQFRRLVTEGKVHYVYLTGTGGGPGGAQGSSTEGSIAQWLASHATVVPTSAYGGSGSGAGGTLYEVTAAQAG